jgi:hypothetical protein
LAIFLWWFWDLSLWDLVGVYAWTLHGSFPSDSLPKSVSKGARFWGFPRFRESGVLGGNPTIPLDLTSSGGPNRSYGMPMRYSYYPQSLVWICWANREIGIWIWSWPAGCYSSWAPRPDRSNRCPSPVWPVQTPVGFLLGWTCRCVSHSLGLLLFRVWAILELFMDLGFPGLGQSDWCVVPA